MILYILFKLRWIEAALECLCYVLSCLQETIFAGYWSTRTHLPTRTFSWSRFSEMETLSALGDTVIYFNVFWHDELKFGLLIGRQEVEF